MNKEEILKLLFDKFKLLYSNDHWIYKTINGHYTIYKIDNMSIIEYEYYQNIQYYININECQYICAEQRNKKEKNKIDIIDLKSFIEYVKTMYNQQFIKYLKDKKK